MTGAPFSRDPISHLHGVPIHTVSKHTQPVNTHIHHSQPTVTRGEKEVERVAVSGEVESRLLVTVLPKARSSSRPGRRAVPTRARGTQTQALDTRGAPQSREPDNEDAATSRFLPRWLAVVAAGAACAPTAAGTSTLLSRSPTYVPRVSLNSKIFFMSSACFFQEELLSPFSRAMADEGDVCGGRRGGAAGARGAGVGALRRGRPATGAQAAAASRSGRAGAGARGC